MDVEVAQRFLPHSECVGVSFRAEFPVCATSRQPLRHHDAPFVRRHVVISPCANLLELGGDLDTLLGLALIDRFVIVWEVLIDISLDRVRGRRRQRILGRELAAVDDRDGLRWLVARVGREVFNRAYERFASEDAAKDDVFACSVARERRSSAEPGKVGK